MTSSVLKWPDRREVDAAARRWAERQWREHPELLRLGYIGSYARGDWGVGSDLDLLALVVRSDLPFEARSLGWDLAVLPVPAELLIYTIPEWRRLAQEGGRFARAVQREAVWIWARDKSPPSLGPPLPRD